MLGLACPLPRSPSRWPREAVRIRKKGRHAIRGREHAMRRAGLLSRSASRARQAGPATRHVRKTHARSNAILRPRTWPTQRPRSYRVSTSGDTRPINPFPHLHPSSQYPKTAITPSGCAAPAHSTAMPTYARLPACAQPYRQPCADSQALSQSLPVGRRNSLQSAPPPPRPHGSRNNTRNGFQWRHTAACGRATANVAPAPSAAHTRHTSIRTCRAARQYVTPPTARLHNRLHFTPRRTARQSPASAKWRRHHYIRQSHSQAAPPAVRSHQRTSCCRQQHGADRRHRPRDCS